MCLKIENCYLKIFVEIRVGEKCVEMREMLFKNWKLLFENTNQTPPKWLQNYYLLCSLISTMFLKQILLLSLSLVM